MALSFAADLRPLNFFSWATYLVQVLHDTILLYVGGTIEEYLW